MVLHLTLYHFFFLFCLNRYGTEAPAENRSSREKKFENQEKKLINQEKRPFRIRDKYMDRDSEYLLQENEQDVTLDQQLLEDLQKKKSDPRYIEMQVMGKKDLEKIFICPLFSNLIKMYLQLEVVAWYIDWFVLRFLNRPFSVGILYPQK